MYAIFQELLKKNGLKPFDVSKATGISSSTLTDWKMGRSTPKQDKMQKIADYFGVTLDYLMTGKESKSKLSEYNEQEKLLITLKHDKKLLDSVEKFYKLSNDKKQHVIELIDLLNESSK